MPEDGAVSRTREDRARDADGRPLNDRARDSLGRPLPPGRVGVPPLPDDIDTSPAAIVTRATRLLDQGLPFQAHEVLEAGWKAAPDAQRAAWQGLAQLAVALTHHLRGNPRGAQRVGWRGRENVRIGELPEVAWPLRDRLLRDLAQPLSRR